jgi:hypothetical protein
MKPQPHEYYPITPALQTLQARYPWPAESPNLPFDRRRWFAPIHMRALLDHLPERPLLILEIGSYMGASLRFMMEASPGSFFIAIDPLDEMIAAERAPHIRRPLGDFLVSNCWPYRDRLVIVPKRSVDALPELRQLGIAPDVAYIDGAHDYVNVKGDVDGCLALNPDIILLGDDYGHPAYEGLRRAVHESADASRRRVVCLQEYLWGLVPS